MLVFFPHRREIISQPAPVTTHAPDPMDIEMRQHLHRLLDACRQNPTAKASAVVASTVATIDSEVVKGQMANTTLLRQQVNYQKASAGPEMPTNPQRREDLQLPQSFTVGESRDSGERGVKGFGAELIVCDTLLLIPTTFLFSLQVTMLNEPFLLFDSNRPSGVDSNESSRKDPMRILVFATQKDIDLLKTCSEWFLDGTFSTSFEIFAQLYTIHVKLPSGKAVPVVYAFLPSKDVVIYRKLLEIIDEAIDGYVPQALHVDFEIGMIQELEAVLPSAMILGCNFHFNKCIWRHIQDDRTLRHRHVEDRNFNLDMRMFAALAFVPVADVRTSFDIPVSSAFVQENTDLLSTFLRYFQTTGIGRSYNPAKFQLDWWNAYSTTLAN